MVTAEHRHDPKSEAVSQPLEPVSVPPVPALRQAPPAPQQKRRRRLWLWGGAGALAAILALLAGLWLWMAGPPVVAVERASLAPVTRILAVNGRIAAVNSVEIRSVVSGNLIALPVAEGDVIEPGQILAEIDAAAQNAIVRQAMAALDAAVVARQQALEDHDRAVSLGANVPRTLLESQAHALQLATQELARQTAALDQAMIVLENHTVRAPAAGTVLTLDAELGQLVGPSTPLLTLADLRNPLVEADVDEAYATQIALNQKAILQLSGEADNREGRVSFVSARVDPATGGLAIKIAFDAPVTAPVGLTVATNIIVEQRDAALTVPRTAMLSDSDETGVLLVRGTTAQRQPVAVVDWPAARLIVTKGLAEGDLVITDPTGIKDGQTVAPGRP